MTLEELRAKVREWDAQNPSNKQIADAKYDLILNQIEYHAKKEWSVYLPAEHPDFNANYMDRLAEWIGNSPSEGDQKLLLEYALEISFFSHDDFLALYRTALNRNVFHWVASQINIKLDQNGGLAFHDEILAQIHQHTWFCPITDSMDINEFYKVNHLAGISERPGFSSLQKMAEHPRTPNLQIIDDWSRYMACPNDNPNNPDPPLERLVLLEDIVGSGSQCIKAVRWAVAKLAKPVLFIPLILCPNGVDALREEEKKWKGKLTIQPVIELSRRDLLGPESQSKNPWPIAQGMEELARRVSGVDAFGYKNTGCSLATFSNTPDNTLPLVHRKLPRGNWNPLFPRVDRGD